MIELTVRLISPTKIAICWVISSEANVRPMMMPRYLARSPTSIFSATRFMRLPRRLDRGQRELRDVIGQVLDLFDGLALARRTAA